MLAQIEDQQRQVLASCFQRLYLVSKIIDWLSFSLLAQWQSLLRTEDGQQQLLPSCVPSWYLAPISIDGLSGSPYAEIKAAR